MQSEKDWLISKLAEFIIELRQFRWIVETGSQKKTFEEWVHARRLHPRGIDESMVAARFDDDGRLVLKKYALPSGKPEWFECDEKAFHGFAQAGGPGLICGFHQSCPTLCDCGKKVHRSPMRAQAFARRVAQEAGSDAHQRCYRCDGNPRAFHLSSKKRSGAPIPGAYVVLEERWNA